MWSVNRQYGAYEVASYDRQYGELGGQSRYYRIPLRRWDRRHIETAAYYDRVDAGFGLQLPVGREHPLLNRARSFGVFDEPACTKLTVSNFITRGYARYAEFLATVAPAGTGHMYFTSCLDEMVDKSIRVLKHQRTEGQVVIGVEGGYFGHTTAASRSVSDNADGFFPWPKVPHPSDDPSRTIAALERLVEEHGAERLLGVYVETVQSQTGQILTDEAFAALAAFRDRTSVPIVLSETTTGMYRSGRGRWWLDGSAHTADVVLFWCGGQIGHIFCSDAAFVKKPLAFISTWDGDELSGTRNRWAFEAASMAPIADRIKRLDEGLDRIDIVSRGTGLYRILQFAGGRDGQRRAAEVLTALANRGVDLEYVAPNALRLAPPVTISANDLDRVLQALSEVA
jgi:acetylornithine/succinyldiaminopimelate/putrescine aminotransferase